MPVDVEVAIEHRQLSKGFRKMHGGEVHQWLISKMAKGRRPLIPVLEDTITGKPWLLCHIVDPSEQLVDHCVKLDAGIGGS